MTSPLAIEVADIVERTNAPAYQLSIRFPADLIETVDAIARELHLTRSRVIVALLRRGLNLEKKK